MDIHEKIIQLKKVVPENGATEAEALTALRLANRLMEKHGISEENLLATEFERDMHRRGVDKQNNHQDPALKLCAVTIAKFCGVQFWWSRMSITPKKEKVFGNIFGYNGDVEMAEFLMDLVSKSMERSWTDYLKAGEYDRSISRHRLYWSFRHGFADRINSKLDEMMKMRAVPTGTDLVVLKDQMVAQGMKELLPDLNLRDGRRSSMGISRDAYADGVVAGNRVNLNRPINQKAGVRSLT